MPRAVWQDLCLDALDVARQADFWAAVSGLTRVGPLEHTRLEGLTKRHTVWINEVDRPHVVKNRTHLDVDAGSVEELLDLGATVLVPATQTIHWTMMADPEGNEFCAFVREPDRLPAYRLHGIGIDCVDAERQARWWGELFGVEPVEGSGADGASWWTLEGVAADDRMTLDFNVVPEPRTVPNRLHWDVQADADDLAAVLAAGATHLWDTDGWTVLADPEGNEFCVFAPR